MVVVVVVNKSSDSCREEQPLIDGISSLDMVFDTPRPRPHKQQLPLPLLTTLPKTAPYP